MITAIALSGDQALEMAKLLKESVRRGQSTGKSRENMTILIYCADQTDLSDTQSQELAKPERWSKGQIRLSDFPVPDTVFAGDSMVLGLPVTLDQFLFDYEGDE